MTKNKTVIIWLSFTRLCQALIGLATIRLSTRFLPQEQFGLLGLLMAITTFFGLFFINPIGQYLNRHTHEWHHHGVLRRKLIQYNRYLVCLTLLSIAFTATWYKLHTFPTVDWFLIVTVSSLVAAMIWAGTWNATLIPLLNMLGKQEQSASLALVTTLASLLCSVMLVQISAQVSTWLTGQVLGLLIGAIVAAYLLRNHLSIQRQSFEEKFISKIEVIHYCLPIAASTGLMWFLSNGYRFYIDYVWGGSALAIFIVGFAISGQFWAIIETIGSQVIYPKYYYALSINNKQYSRLAFFHMKSALLPSYIFMLFFGISVAPKLITLLTDSRYSNAVEYCQIAMIFEFLRVFTNIQMQAAQIEKKTSPMIIPYLVAAICGIAGVIFNATFFHSLKNFPWIMAISWTVAAITAFYLIGKHSNSKIQTKPIAISTACGALILLCSKLLPNNNSFIFQSASIGSLGLIAIAMLYLIQKNNDSIDFMLHIKLPAEKFDE